MSVDGGLLERLQRAGAPRPPTSAPSVEYAPSPPRDPIAGFSAFVTDTFLPDPQKHSLKDVSDGEMITWLKDPSSMSKIAEGTRRYLEATRAVYKNPEKAYPEGEFSFISLLLQTAQKMGRPTIRMALNTGVREAAESQRMNIKKILTDTLELVNTTGDSRLTVHRKTHEDALVAISDNTLPRAPQGILNKLDNLAKASR